MRTSNKLDIDMQLYSRQVLVYGKSAQASFQNARVMLYGQAKDLLLEVSKNLVLAGIGEIILFDTNSECDNSVALLCSNMTSYLSNLNKNTKVF
jgi:molybdopterin/thiamine biosynthesis adenylyltransferase